VTHPFDNDLEFTPYEKDRIMQLKQENQLDELFCMLFIKQCNALNAILPNLFEKTSDYTELLLNVVFTDKDGLVYRLVHDISEDDFKEAVEIIGWMYQYYNDERKNQVINIYKGTVKKEDISAATQLFTTDWVVRYMVDNSLGLYWIERNPQSKLHEKLEFFVTPKSGEITYIDEKVEPKDLTFFDPCMGSGHILVYTFDVLMEIYRERGYSDRDAAVCILKDNLYGLDIDDRAYQLAYFAVMMKARSYNRRVLTMGILPNVCAIQESNGISTFVQNGITVDSKLNVIGEYLIEQYCHAKEVGSLQSVDQKNYDAFEAYLRDCEKAVPMDLFSSAQFNYTANIMRNLVQQAKIMAKKYTIVCTNPPYMNKLESHLKEFVINQYKPYSGDLFSVFMYRNFGYCRPNGYSAFMTPFVWMFIKTYENLRKFIINNKSITTLIQMEYSAFEEATVPICSFVLQNAKDMQNGYYFKLSDFKGGMEVQKQKVLEALVDKNCGYFFETNAENFSKIPGMPIAYWISDKMIYPYSRCLSEQLIYDVLDLKAGLSTADNPKYLRHWSEVEVGKIGFYYKNIEQTLDGCHKWFPCNSGGEFRKWSTNDEYVIDWELGGRKLKLQKGAALRNQDCYFQEGLTWNKLSSSRFAVKYKGIGYIFDDTSRSAFGKHKEYSLYYIAGFLCSRIAFQYLQALNPTMSFTNYDLERLPIIFALDQGAVERLVKNNIAISQLDWDAFEVSWNFQRHPLLIYGNNGQIAYAFASWEVFAYNQFAQLKANEEELNRIFIEIYGLQDELTPEVEEKDVTIRKADLGRDIRSFILYAVGCMFGRYSLDKEGLVFAGGDFEDYYRKYKGHAALDKDGNPIRGGYAGISLASYRYADIKIDGAWKRATYEPDADNIIPITDEEYFEDDIVGLFVAFVKKAYGAETLEENLDFIAAEVGNKGNTSREIIRNYFLKNFFKDHCKVYQKCPIYWLFDSGKADGFKALIYMHRYDENTIGNLRIDYLHKMQRVYERELARMQETIDNSTNAREVTAAEKRKDKLTKQLKETKDYDEKIAHLALARIAIDLDDGVKVNYEKVQTGIDGKKLDVLATI
jgi:hypothetical protein